MARPSLSFALAMLILGLLAPTASAATIAPTTATVGVPTSFSCSDCADSAVITWDLDGDGTFGEVVDDANPHTFFGSAGVRPIAINVDGVDSPGSVTLVDPPPPPNRPPVIDGFDWFRTSPFPGEQIRFEADVTDPDGGTPTLEWDFGDGGKGSGQRPTHTYATARTYTVTLRASDDGGSDTETRQLTVQDPTGPTASFTIAPAVPLAGEKVTFTNTSTQSTAPITSAVWDLDDDGEFDDSPVGWSFGTPGHHLVALRVTQSDLKQAVKQVNLRVNAAPIPGFVWSPLGPGAGQAIDLISTSVDSEGELRRQAWDIDGDGQFDDATGATVPHSFDRAGKYEVGLQVTDSDGVVRTLRRNVTVSAVVIAATQLRFITPFPVVRLAGKVLPHGARIRVLAVRAPRRAVIQVRCLGKGCPIGSVRRTSRGRTVRFSQFERRLRAGIRLKLFMRQPGRIGKYTSFLIRAGSPPKRVDRCLYPTGRSLRRCP
jgi:PKD repeat protein